MAIVLVQAFKHVREKCQFRREIRRERERYDGHVQVTEDFTSDLSMRESHQMGGGQTIQDMIGFIS